MSQDSGSASFVPETIKQQQRNQAWIDFLSENQDALEYRLRSSGATNSRRGHGSMGRGDEFDFAEFQELNDDPDPEDADGLFRHGNGATSDQQAPYPTLSHLQPSLQNGGSSDIGLQHLASLPLTQTPVPGQGARAVREQDAALGADRAGSADGPSPRPVAGSQTRAGAPEGTLPTGGVASGIQHLATHPTGTTRMVEAGPMDNDRGGPVVSSGPQQSPLSQPASMPSGLQRSQTGQPARVPFAPRSDNAAAGLSRPGDRAFAPHGPRVGGQISGPGGATFAIPVLETSAMGGSPTNNAQEHPANRGQLPVTSAAVSPLNVARPGSDNPGGYEGSRSARYDPPSVDHSAPAEFPETGGEDWFTGPSDLGSRSSLPEPR